MESQTFVAKQIARGVYTLSKRTKGKSFIWNVLAIILKEDGTAVKNLVYCRTCYKVLKCIDNQTSNLTRHKCCRASRHPPVLKTVSAEDKLNAFKVCTAWGVKDCRPFSAVSGLGFVELVKFFIKIGATYGENVDVMDLLPEPTTISQQLQNSAVEKKLEFKSEINEIVNSGGASATIDMWSDNYVKRNFLGVTLHYQKDSKFFDIVLGLKSMDFERSTALNIRKKLKSLFTEFGVENIKSIKFITDKGKNIVKALEHNTRLNCSSHLFANVLDKSFGETAELTEIIQSCRAIVKYFKKTNLQHMLETSLESQSPTTRWSSNYTMFKSLLDNWFKIKEVLNENGKSSLLQTDISTLKTLVDLCQGFEIVFKTIESCSSPSLCFVLPSIDKIKSICATDSGDLSVISVLKAQINQNIDKIWLQNLNIWHKIAFFLYPPAAGMQQSDIKDITKFCVSCIRDLENTTTSTSDSVSSGSQPPSPAPLNAPTNTSSAENPSTKQHIHFFFSDLLKESAKATPEEELERYSSQVVRITENFDLIAWWNLNANSYPYLSKFALQVHSIPASSAASERTFLLAAGNVVTEKQTRLGPKTVDSLLFLNSYYKNFNVE